MELTNCQPLRYGGSPSKGALATEQERYSIPNITGPWSAHWKTTARDSGAKVATANTAARPKPAVANPAADKGSDGEASRRRTEWTKAKPRNPERRRARPDAIVIQAVGLTYSQILSMVTLREDGKLDDLGPCVKKVRKTAKGGLLLELARKKENSTQAPKGCIEEVLGSKAEVRAYSKETKESLVELRGLDALATSEDIIGAIAQQAAVDQGALKVKKLSSSYGETQTAIVAFPASLAKASYGEPQTAIVAFPASLAKVIIAVGKVKVGWSVCHMKEKEVVARCYRCLGMGHIASACKSSNDRSGCCYRCGDTDHRAATCKKDPRCFSCEDKGRKDVRHQAGSRSCPMAAQDVLSQTARETKADIALLSEPLRTGSDNCWAVDLSGKAAIWSCGATGATMHSVHNAEGFVRARIGGAWLYSCYMAPSLTTNEFERMMDCLGNDISGRSDVLVAGDFNAWALDSLDLVLLNEGNQHTFSRAGAGSIIDLTPQELPRDPNPRDYRVGTLQARKFTEAARDIGNVLPSGANEMADTLAAKLEAACMASMQRRSRYRRNHAPVYWWSDEIGSIRAECMRARRLMQRARGSDNFEERHLAFKDRRKAIRDSKRKCFLDLCDLAEENPWGNAHRIVVKRLRAGSQSPTDPNVLRTIVQALFPAGNQVTPLPTPPADNEPAEEVTEEEVLAIGRGLAPNKAPGPDSVPNRALTLALSLQPGSFQELYNKWKPREEASSYRPICLLDTTGKVFKRVIAARLEAAIEEAGGLSPKQYGFRKERSMVDAIAEVVGIARNTITATRWKGGSKQYCLIVTLDIRNAFNTADWGKTLAALRGFNVPSAIINVVSSYFSCRVLLVDTDMGTESFDVTAGVPQGSVLGPLLWIAMYDGILRLQLPAGCDVVGFADDVALVIVAKHREEAERATNKAIEAMEMWLQNAGLSGAPQKTEAVLVSSRKVLETATIRVGGMAITPQRAKKYLGVMIDARFSFREHLEYIEETAAATTRGLARIFLNTRGPKQNRRRLLVSVASAEILNAAPIWAEAMNTPSYRRGVDAAYRLGAIRVACGFRTVFDDAILVIAGIVPLKERARELMEPAAPPIQLQRRRPRSGSSQPGRIAGTRRRRDDGHTPSLLTLEGLMPGVRESDSRGREAPGKPSGGNAGEPDALGRSRSFCCIVNAEAQEHRAGEAFYEIGQWSTC
ncbi:uncharacterized protein [Drosophila bipectinata]|uniref:uncharacterized protein n=1 Tax=Drosophila bipectinata TaxID=42026 RepID=UPI0038B347A2